MAKELATKDKDQITNEYFGNEAAKIRRLSDFVLKKIGFTPNYPDEFYSLAGEVFINAMEKWDPEKGKFEPLLYSMLSKRFKSLLTWMNADKRGGSVESEVSLYTELGEDLTLEDTIGEEQIIDNLSPEMIEYFRSLNATQRSIYIYLSEGYEPGEIQKKLGITSKVYNRELRDAKAYEKIKVLDLPDVPNHSKNSGTIEITEIKETKEEINKGENNLSMSIRKSEMTAGTTTVATLMQEVKCGTLRDDNPLQRATDNWNSEMKGNLIVVALEGNRIPGIVICQRKIGDSYVREIIDGLQRFSTFAGYINNGYRISKKVEHPFIPYNVFKGYDENGLPINEERVLDVRGKKFQDLPEELQIKITGFNIQCDTYLHCSNEDVEYHIRRLNSSRSMNHSQRGLTFVGTTLAIAIKRISNGAFFRDTYKPTDFRNGNIQRLIQESVMLINFAKDWVPQPEKIGSFLCENATTAQFEAFEDLVERIDDVLDDETRKLFTMRDSFLWFKVFDEFDKLGLEDERFNDFLNAWDSLKGTEIDGNTFETLNSKNTKGASVIMSKIDYITAVMYQFFGEEKEEEADLVCGDKFDSYVNEFRDLMDGIVDCEEKTAVKTFYALKGEDDLSDSHVQELINKEETDLTEEFEDTLSYVQDFLDDWALSVDQSSSVLKEDKIPALIRLYKLSCDSDVEGNRVQNWFVNFADQEAVNRKLVGNYQKDWETLKKAFKAFVNYETLGAA